MKFNEKHSISTLQNSVRINYHLAVESNRSKRRSVTNCKASDQNNNRKRKKNRKWKTIELYHLVNFKDKLNQEASEEGLLPLDGIEHSIISQRNYKLPIRIIGGKARFS